MLFLFTTVRSDRSRCWNSLWSLDLIIAYPRALTIGYTNQPLTTTSTDEHLGLCASQFESEREARHVLDSISTWPGATMNLPTSQIPFFIAWCASYYQTHQSCFPCHLTTSHTALLLETIAVFPLSSPLGSTLTTMGLFTLQDATSALHT